MGAAESKPQGYVWKSAGPPSVSHSVIESLQSSPESDASRARLVEQHVQARLGEELKRLSAQETEALKLAQDRIAQDAAATAARDDGRATSYTLGREVEELREKLERRRTLKEVPRGVEVARSSVIRCLRDNDRRPLECYEEVERFKAEVKKMEREWVDRVTA
ncbi:putative altered inheritance of mitochondria protein 13 [Escovopsis weberi]|uniref:Putative altered inheritance of mitochondria protein 13 n=1 Tax=Escovopsis weberi TaxID=150374 RepID=A0A0M9VVC9_ESCWE|nr:putative altered inheritance of mitochondria protein 13 [Escovopsis weberi]